MEGFFPFIIIMSVVVLFFCGLWKIYVKAGEPGWTSLVPIYNLYIFLKIIGRPWWWIILACIPFVGLVLLVTPFDLSKRFGRGTGFGFGLLFLFFIFYPILGYGNTEYTAPEV